MGEKETLILGIDPGTVVTGFGIIATNGLKYRAIDFGCIRPPAKLPLPDRYLIIFEGVLSLIKKNKPDVVSVETQYVGKNVQSAIKLGMARGTVLVAARKCEVDVFEYTPTQAKKSVVGRGGASKQQVIGMTQRLLSLSEPPHPEDAADALALALCHALKLKPLQFVIG